MTAELDAVAADLSTRIPGLLAEHAIPGMAVAVVHGRDSWVAGFGRTRRQGGAPVGELTMFSLQSISKTFTALAVLAAVRDGLLDLDAPVSRYLPDFTVRSRTGGRPHDLMTLRHLLSHTAGLAHEAPVGGNYDTGDESFGDHVRSIRDTWLRWPVGTRYGYSNLGVDLAAHILATVRSRDFAACAREAVFAPLGQSRSSFDPAVIKADLDRAAGHRPAAAEPPVNVPMVGAGGMYACAADLARFLQAELDGPVLPPGLTTLMRTVPFPVPGQAGGYGLGLAIMPGPGWTVYGHSGGGFGFLTDLYWEPAARTGVAVLTNSSAHPLLHSFAMEILARLAGRDPKNQYGSGPVPSGPADAVGYGRFSGQYVGDHGWIDLAANDGAMGLRGGDGRFTPVHALGNGDLLMPLSHAPAPARVRMLATPGGHPVGAVVLDGGDTLSFNSAPGPPPPAAAVRAARDAAAYAGDYASTGTGPEKLTARVEFDDGRLWLAIPDAGMPRLRLDPHEPADGLYFTSLGDCLDLRAEPPRFASIALARQP